MGPRSRERSTAVNWIRLPGNAHAAPAFSAGDRSNEPPRLTYTDRWSTRSTMRVLDGEETIGLRRS